MPRVFRVGDVVRRTHSTYGRLDLKQGDVVTVSEIFGRLPSISVSKKGARDTDTWEPSYFQLYQHSWKIFYEWMLRNS